MTGWNSPPKRQFQVIAVVVLGLGMLCSGPLLALDFDALSGTAKAKVVPLTYLTQEQGRQFLARLKLATASPLPGTNALLVTAEPEELRKAVAVLAVVDTADQYDIKVLDAAAAPTILPSNEQIEAAVGNICIGTFAQPPREAGKPKAFVDRHNGEVVAIAPIFQLQDIMLAVEFGSEILKRRNATAERPGGGAALPTVGTNAMLGSSFGSQSPDAANDAPALPNAAWRQAMRKRLQELRVRSEQIPDSPTLAPRSFEADGAVLAERASASQADSSLPASLAPAGFQEPNEALSETIELESLAPVIEDAAMLQPGQVVPADANELVPSEAMSALDANRPALPGAVSPPVPDVASYEPDLLLDGDRVVDLSLPETLPVIQLLDLVGKYMNLTYLYDPTQITGEVTLKLNGTLQGSMRVKDLYLLLESVLKFKNLAMTRHKDNVVTIVPVANALEVDPQLVGPGEPEVQAGDVVVTRVFELRYIDTASAKNLLDGMKLSVDVTPIAESHTLIVTAYAYRMNRIAQLLQMVDKPGEPRRFRYRQLKYTMARTLAEKVKGLAEQLESVSVTVAAPAPETTTPQLPGENAAQYQQRLARLRALQTARQRTAQPGQTPEEAARPGVYLDADERTNRILMIGIEEQLTVVDDLVNALDVEQQDLRTLKLYRMEFVDAEEVSKKLAELGIINRTPETTASSRITQTGTPGAMSPAAAAAQARAAAQAAAAGISTTEVTEEGPVEQPQVVVIESTNSLLVNATAEQHAQIETIVSYVDSEMLETEIPYKIYPLENSSPEGLAAVLESLIQETTENRDQEGKIQTTVIRRQEEIKIVPDPNTYSLIVYASKKNQEWISNLVKQLDKRRPQVLIDVTLVEITKTDQFNHDLNAIQGWPTLQSTSDVSGFELQPSSIGKFVETASGAFTAFYGDRHIQALLTAVRSKNYGRVLAKPKILVNDNQPGIIKTTDTTYVETTSSIPFRSGTAGDQTDLITTATDYTPYEAGLELNITPHISEGDLLRLDVSLVRSDFKPTGDTTKPPDQTASEINTAVTVPDGSTIILGGLIRLNQNKGGKKVPLLGDLPLLGGLFRSTNNTDNQSKLYVFVKAEVIRPDQSVAHGRDELERLSERNRVAFEKHETTFQRYQNWPGIKPKPVDPPKVLDAQ